MPKPPSPWPERDAELRRHQSQGLPWEVIAQRMHLSRFSVKARAHRLGLNNSKLATLSNERRRRHPPRTTLPRPKPVKEYKGQVIAPKTTLPPLPSLQMPMPEIHIEDNDVNDC
jgi:hypothetical protein